jgi:hypothetical protein
MGQGYHASKLLSSGVMPLQVLDIKGVPHNRRERITAAVEAGGKHLSDRYEAWLRLDFDGKVRVILTGPRSFERYVIFRPDEETATVTEMVRVTLDE